MLTVLTSILTNIRLIGVSHTSASTLESTSPLLMVVISIGCEYEGIAADSHRAYAARHGYRLHVQRKWRGTVKRPKYKRATHAQKLLACQHARGEKFVLVLDSDVVIAPWTPPIHDTVGRELGNRIGIVDEDQPTSEIRTAVEKKLLGKTTNVTEYYAQFGAKFELDHGMLNSGVLLVPRSRYEWLREVYYAPQSRAWFAQRHNHVDQPILGSAMLKDNAYQLIHHAWNRGWVYYKNAAEVGGESYEIGQVFRSSYFVHFYWHRKGQRILEEWMHQSNVTFEPRPYIEYLLP